MFVHEVMAAILQPRAEEVFTLIREEEVRAGFERTLNAGIVLTGGGGLLPGMTEVAEQVLDMPVRHGQPGGADGLTQLDLGTQHATAIGLALYGATNQKPRRRMSIGVPVGMLGRMGGKFGRWISEMFGPSH